MLKKIFILILPFLLIFSGVQINRNINAKKKEKVRLMVELDSIHKINYEYKYSIYEIILNNEDVKEQIIDIKNKQIKVEDEIKTLKVNIKDLDRKIEIQKNRNNFNIYSVYSMNKPSGKVVYLTFDDGPSKNTEKILNTLKEYNVKATFFVCGNNTDFGISIYKRIVNEGHAIGNHTYTHNYSFIYSDLSSFKHDFYNLENLLYRTIGIKPQIIRYPGGSNNQVSYNYGGRKIMPKVINYMNSNGYVHFDWNVTSGDASGKNYTYRDIANNVLRGIENKSAGIVLMHDSWPKTETAKAVPIIVEELLNRGYEFRVLTKDSFRVQFINVK